MHPSRSVGGARRGPRRAELLAALSLAIDLGLGQPMEHMLRSAVVATRLSDRCGLDAAQRGTVYYATLIAWIGCHADSHELAALFGDDIAFRADTYRVDRAGLPFLRLMLRHTGDGLPVWDRGLRQAAFLVTARARVTDLIRSHCTSARVFADRVGCDRRVGEAIAATFERWDGSGLPAGLRGDDLPVEAQVAQIADVVEVHLRAGGLAQAVDVVRARSGGQFGPVVAETFVARAEEIVAGLLDTDVWAAALEQAPDRGVILTEPELDSLLRSMADFVDLKCPTLLGHSRAVGDLAAAAARVRGMSEADATLLYRAGLVHGLGRMGVPNSIWEKSGPLTAAEWERVRLYPYLTGRILRRVDGLGPVVALATAHRERLDGSGFPRGVSGAELTQSDRLLAAAEAYRRGVEPRPHRAGLGADGAAERIRRQAREGRLDPAAVDAVLAASGGRVPRRTRWPAGLTDREVEVLRLLARGRSNRDVAQDLSIATKTVRNHVEHIYLKLGVNNRTQASLAAIDHGLAGVSAAE
ncbi:HD domain-containing phosphohydrolase [Rhodococcus sp. NPDC127528]|uniref:HD domain-containing phosphohydrolase n=1 Tax=unclassified Rhodococcus (in: high G+C Gram-positive bacteria) TaxID=192944 RepID=UPI00363AB989